MRICCEAIRSSPIPALQVEMRELPLDTERVKLMLTYCISVKGLGETHPIKKVLGKCLEHESDKFRSFGRIAEEEAQSCGIMNVEMSPAVVVSPISLWLFPLPLVDFNLQEMINDKNGVIAKDVMVKVMVKLYLEQNYNSAI